MITILDRGGSAQIKTYALNLESVKPSSMRFTRNKSTRADNGYDFSSTL